MGDLPSNALFHGTVSLKREAIETANQPVVTMMRARHLPPGCCRRVGDRTFSL
jgi:hypothetical protein